MTKIAGHRRLAAEALGSAALLAVVVGSGIMGERLAGGNVAMALLANTLATGAALVVLITLFGPISGAHFNPAVTFAMLLRRDIGWTLALGYMAAQLVGGVLGVFVAHAMFAEPILQISSHHRDGAGLEFSEFVATFGLLATIFGCQRFRPQFAATAVGLYISSAYWFTASTAFANPAVTIARALSDSFSGIAPASVAPFVLAQMAGAVAAIAVCRWLFEDSVGVTCSNVEGECHDISAA